MIVPNLILFNDLFKINYQKYENIHRLTNFKLNNSSILIISNANSFVNKSANQLLKISNYNNFTSRNFWQKFINKYWQETIFISASNNISEKYINKLKSSGLSVYKGNDYKNFLFRFSQDLLDGKILVSTKDVKNQNVNLLINKENTYIKYKWTKFLNFEALKLSKTIFQDYIDINNKNIKYETLPLFALINHNYQIIMSESPDKLFRSKSCVSLFLKFFNDLFLKSSTSQKVYTGLLFVNPEDALEYKQHIQHNYTNSTRINYIESVTTNINLYYKLLNSCISNSEFRLIPDLKEVSDLIYKYRKYKHLSFDSNQKYGSNYFQGQPIYLIKPVVVRNKNTNQKEALEYSYSFPSKNSSVPCQAVFLNYKTAIKAWDKFKKRYIHYNLPLKPDLYVSNLESFIKGSYYNNANNQIVFIPSFQTYKFIKNFMELKDESYRTINQIILDKSFSVKIFLSRVIWSLTSRKPVNW
uniref:Ycf80 n=1 Tax=Bostrychia tenella TaxID=324755 RepID=A0A1Z1M5L0_9FLOR|nr:hypothetical protein [Bostrychia tenella]ARW61212.1 hypothetical protein [Bostrychia tenella]